MAKLNTAMRKKLPKSDFGLPGKKAYPMPDRAHAANAKARASQFASPEERSKIDAKANKILGEKKSMKNKKLPMTSGMGKMKKPTFSHVGF